jgi:hypothetical protein
MKLYTTEAQYLDLVETTQTGRSRTVALSRVSVRNLVLDHGRLIAKLDRLGEKIEPGKPNKGA